MNVLTKIVSLGVLPVLKDIKRMRKLKKTNPYAYQIEQQRIEEKIKKRKFQYRKDQANR